MYNEELESRIKQAVKDWENTGALVEAHMKLYRNLGVDTSKLSPETLLSLVEGISDSVLAKKNQATRISIKGGGHLTDAAAIMSLGQKGGNTS